MILVTGASGLLGGRLCQVLVEQKSEPVRVLARQTSDLSHLDSTAIEVAYGALEDPDSLAEAVRGVKTIYHCAGLSSDWDDPARFVAVNVDGVRHLLRAAAQERIERFLHVSTTDVYGYPKEACAESYGRHDVGLPYNQSKIRGEELAFEMHEQEGVPVTVIRPATIYGPRSKDFVVEIAKLLRAGSMMVINGGRSPAGLIYVDNVVEAMIAAANSDKTIGQVYNVRDESGETWLDYVDALAAGIGARRVRFSLPEWLALMLARSLEVTYGLLRLKSRPLLTRHAVYVLSRDQCYAIDHAHADFGFASRVSFAEGMRRTIDWLGH